MRGICSGVAFWFTCGLGGRMPKGILLEDEARQTAAFVAAYAGQIDKGPTVDIATQDLAEPPPSCDSGAASGP